MYSAIVTRIQTRPHPNADKIKLGTCLGNQVVVGLDQKDGDLGVFFPTDGQLSHSFCLENNLYNASARVKLELPPSDKIGFFDAHRRVRAQSFRGERSDGFWVPLSFLAWAGSVETLKEGDTFTSFAGEEICNKYFNPKTLRMLRGQKQGQISKKSPFFPEHIDTPQFRFVADTIPEDGVYYVTEKMHGTSGRYAFVPNPVQLPWFMRFMRKLCGLPTEALEWTYLNGSRRVTIGTTTGEGYYGTNQFRYDAVANLSLRKGEILYFELVGYVNETTKIMPSHDATKTQDKSVLSKYGKEISYTYGCPPGTCRLYLYKIAHTNEDGIITEQPWTTVQVRAKELGLATVPLLSGPLTADLLKRKWATDNFHEALRWEVENHALGSSSFNDLQLKEGVVLRIESPTLGISHAKSKQHLFGVLEGYLKDDDTSIDLEDVS